jgi:hypothetical protein
MYFVTNPLGLSTVRRGSGRVRAPIGCLSPSLDSQCNVSHVAKLGEPPRDCATSVQSEDCRKSHESSFGSWGASICVSISFLTVGNMCLLRVCLQGFEASSMHGHQTCDQPSPLPSPGADFNALEAAGKAAVFFPDYNCRLVGSLAFVDPESGPRPLYSCVRPECGCAGVFFKDCGGSGYQLRLSLWLEHGSATKECTDSGLNAACVGADMRDDVKARVTAFFMDRLPEVTLYYGRAACTETVSSYHTRRWVADPRRVGGGVWEVTFRPSRITGEGVLACLKASVGPNVLWTPGMELRTKPSEWVMLHALPPACTPDRVKALVALMTAHAPDAVVMRRSAVGGVAALVRFSSRTVACGALLGWKAVLSGRTFVAPGSLSDADKGITLSMLISLNRNYKDDATLSRVLVPKVDLTEVVQQQERPGYLSPPQHCASVLPEASLKRPAVDSVEVVTAVDPSISKRHCVDSTSSSESCETSSSDDATSSDYDSDEDEEEDRVVLPVAIALPKFSYSHHDHKVLRCPALSDACEDLADYLGLEMFDDDDWPVGSVSLSPLDCDPIDFDALMCSLVA